MDNSDTLISPINPLECDVLDPLEVARQRMRMVFGQFETCLKTLDPEAKDVTNTRHFDIPYSLPHDETKITFGDDIYASNPHLFSCLVYPGDNFLSGRSVNLQIRLYDPNQEGTRFLTVRVGKSDRERVADPVPNEIILTDKGDFAFYWEDNKAYLQDRSFPLERWYNFLHSGLLKHESGIAGLRAECLYLGQDKIKQPGYYGECIERILAGTEQTARAYKNYIKLLKAGYQPAEALIDSPCHIIHDKKIVLETALKIEEKVLQNGFAIYTYRCGPHMEGWEDAILGVPEAYDQKIRRHRVPKDQKRVATDLASGRGLVYYDPDRVSILQIPKVANLPYMRRELEQWAALGYRCIYLDDVKSDSSCAVLVKLIDQNTRLPQIRMQPVFREARVQNLLPETV